MVSVTAPALVALLALLVAVSHPTAAVGVAVVALAGRRVGRAVRRRLAPPRARSRTARRLCVPGTDVCLEA